MAGFIDIGGNNSPLDAGMELHLPFGSITIPMMIVAGFEGGAPKVALLELWSRVWPKSVPGPLMTLAVFGALAMALQDTRVQQALEEACRPN